MKFLIMHKGFQVNQALREGNRRIQIELHEDVTNHQGLVLLFSLYLYWKLLFLKSSTLVLNLRPIKLLEASDQDSSVENNLNHISLNQAYTMFPMAFLWPDLDPVKK